MKKGLLLTCLFAMANVVIAAPQEGFEKDLIKTSAGDLEITFIGHGTLMFTFGEKVIHVDPWTRLTDYSKLPKADLILITHEHGDHLDSKALELIRTDKSRVIIPKVCAGSVEGGVVMNNGDVQTVMGLKVEAVPAYNLVHMRTEGQPFHLKGTGNGYVITFGGKRIYVAGDTEGTPEMKTLKDIDIAFLPMNVPYTMTPEMAVDAAKAFKPKILYPYHYGETDPSQIVRLLEPEKAIEVRIRKMR